MTAHHEGQVGRTFLVGCPRSGTTLLQALLFAHPDVFSFPETFFFVKTINAAGARHRLRLASTRAPKAIAALGEIGLGGRATARLRRPLTEAACARAFLARVDGATAGANRSTWIEKTPSHLHRIAAIGRYVPRARFIHMIRAGAPTVASLYEVTHSYADSWGGERDLDACAARWSADIERSSRYAGDPAHVFVSYERLAEQPATVTAALCRFLGLTSDAATVDAMLQGYGEPLADVSGDEPWKRQAGGGVSNRNAVKVAQVLDAEQRVQLERMLVAAERRREELPFL